MMILNYCNLYSKEIVISNETMNLKEPYFSNSKYEINEKKSIAKFDAYNNYLIRIKALCLLRQSSWTNAKMKLNCTVLPSYLIACQTLNSFHRCSMTTH